MATETINVTIGSATFHLPTNLSYTDQHEWLWLDPDRKAGVMGITDFAAHELGDVVYVQLPEVGKALDQFAVLSEIESVKAVSEVFSPVSGEVLETNKALADQPELINKGPYAEGWILRLRLQDEGELAKLMDATYAELLQGLKSH